MKINKKEGRCKTANSTGVRNGKVYRTTLPGKHEDISCESESSSEIEDNIKAFLPSEWIRIKVNYDKNEKRDTG